MLKGCTDVINIKLFFLILNMKILMNGYRSEEIRDVEFFSRRKHWRSVFDKARAPIFFVKQNLTRCLSDVVQRQVKNTFI